MSMIDPIPFDTHRFVKRMTEAGMPLPQAEALAEEQVMLIGAQFATRRDADELKIGQAEHKRNIEEIKRDIEEIKLGLAEVKRDIEEIKLELAEVKREIAEIKRDIEELKRGQIEIRQDIAVMKAELTMVKWIVSGVGFGMLLLLVRSFWPV